MAKKRKHTTRRRRRVSGVGSGLMPALVAIGGGVAGRLLSNFAKKQFNLDSTIAGAATAAVGAFVLPMFVKGPTGQQLGFGIAAAGGIELASSFGISGFYSVPTINGMKQVSGSARQRLSGSARQTLSGVDLVNSSASVRAYRPGNYNFATGRNQMSVISGFPVGLYEALYSGQ